jgi:hypothetical protein
MDWVLNALTLLIGVGVTLEIGLLLWIRHLLVRIDALKMELERSSRWWTRYEQQRNSAKHS